MNRLDFLTMREQLMENIDSICDTSLAGLVSQDEIMDKITVTEALDTATMVSGFRPTLASELPTDNADSDTAE